MKNISIISKKPYLEEALKTTGELKDFTIATMDASKAESFITIQDGDKSVTLIVGKCSIMQSKPLCIKEFIASLKEAITNRSFQIGNINFDIKARKVSLDAQEEQLTEKETKLLQALCEASGSIVTADQLLVDVLGYDIRTESKTIETHIYRLRQKLKNLTLEDIIITTHEGYLIKYHTPSIG